MFYIYVYILFIYVYVHVYSELYSELREVTHAYLPCN